LYKDGRGATGDLWTSNFTALGKMRTHYDSRGRPDKTTLLNASGATALAVSEVSYNSVSQVVPDRPDEFG
jgi:hypothetical protein